jgi:hypothetical protein
MAREGGSGSKPVADTKTAKAEAAAKYAGTGEKASKSPKSSTAPKSTAPKSTPQSLTGDSSKSVAYTPSRTPAASLTSLSSSGDNRSGNLRGNAAETLKRTGVTVSDTSRRRSSPNPTAAEVNAIGKQLDALAGMSKADKRREAMEAQGQMPSEGIVDWNGLLFDANAPYRERVERAGGAPFEGPVDWNGIAAAIFGGQSAAERDAAMAAERTPAPWNSYSPINVSEPVDWPEFEDYVRSEAFGAPQRDPESGFIKDPVTGTYYREDLLPTDETRLADNPVASQLPSFAPLEGLVAGIKAEGDRWAAGPQDLLVADVPLPRRDPRGGIADMAIPLPGQVEGGRDPIDITVVGGNGVEESDEARYARENPVIAPKKKTVLDTVVEGVGGLLENTGLGGIVKNLFPDLWYGVGEGIKSLDDGLTYGGGTANRIPFEYLPQNGSLVEPVYNEGGYGPPPAPFPDLNHNGIDDRLEGFSPGVTWGSRTAQFPDLPPYDPGRSNEWKYFTGPGYAEGGAVEGYAEGGVAEDPRMALIADAEDVLEDIAAGQKPSPADAEILKAFVAQFGDDALRALNDQVKSGMKMRGPRGPRLVEGPGTETSDSIPAVIDGNQPAALSDGEVVIPAAAVRAAGDGDRERGAEQLMALSDMLMQK